MDLRPDYETLGVHEQVALATLDLLASIVATLFSAHSGSLDGLGIHYARAGLRVSFQANPQTFSESSIDPLPSAVDAPGSEIVIDSGPSLGKSCGSSRHWQPLLRT